ncbi:MAG TPA: GNAT family protein [Bacillota bacterium]|mgnify:CR=1 FL=1|nr:GNAT family protein [Bacillota bacterium]HPJ23806.1 GNAT family protein [Bacillota bacterium]
MITLQKITKENFRDVLFLEMTDADKRMVASNMYSIAESSVNPHYKPRAIYNDDQLIGFMMYHYVPVEEQGFVSRMMITTKEQGNGYAGQALMLAIKDLKQETNIKSVQISYHIENEKARKAYQKVGFIETGEIDDDERIAIYPL